MGKYSVEIISKAEKEFMKLPEFTKAKIRKQILLLEENLRPFGYKKLKETEYYRIRNSDYRVVYSIDDKIKVVKVLFDEMVYNLYGLTEDEIKIIEG